MEILVNEPIDPERMAELCALGITRPRSTSRDHGAWHVTSLLHAGHLIAKGNITYQDDRSYGLVGVGSLGKIWQTAADCYLTDYAAQRGGVYTPEVELVKNDIIGSLDGLMCFPPLGWMIAETKLRFTQDTDIPLDHLQQVRAYCYLFGTDLVCYFSGHLSSNPPAFRVYLRIVRLTVLSIMECWQGIVNTKDYLIKMGISPTVAPVET